MLDPKLSHAAVLRSGNAGAVRESERRPFRFEEPDGVGDALLLRLAEPIPPGSELVGVLDLGHGAAAPPHSALRRYELDLMVSQGYSALEHGPPGRLRRCSSVRASEMAAQRTSLPPSTTAPLGGRQPRPRPAEAMPAARPAAAPSRRGRAERLLVPLVGQVAEPAQAAEQVGAEIHGLAGRAGPA